MSRLLTFTSRTHMVEGKSARRVKSNARDFLADRKVPPPVVPLLLRLTGQEVK